MIHSADCCSTLCLSDPHRSVNLEHRPSKEGFQVSIRPHQSEGPCEVSSNHQLPWNQQLGSSEKSVCEEVRLGKGERGDAEWPLVEIHQSFSGSCRCGKCYKGGHLPAREELSKIILYKLCCQHQEQMLWCKE
ncbi:hypothetical protein CDAR_207971 [Caerostris darwini]|uniref:Uncharacterized protein n=1 Tax=Caerostris darwini TaxID=1538125 RepID=A0AAV4U3L7_9ARAC|nr:hypothetical protein CDAR_207971 [Caerostris darwini]